MAEWLRSGLQIREGRFDSGSGLHFLICAWWVFKIHHRAIAALAQLVEHIIRNDGVRGSNPLSGTSFNHLDVCLC